MRCFVSNDKLVTMLVHVDDMLASGSRSRLDALFGALKREYTLKHETTCDKPGAVMSMLGRRIERVDAGFRLSGDTKLAYKLVRSLGLEGARAVTTPMVPKPAGDQEELLGEEIRDVLSEAEHHKYRQHVGVISYMASEREDLLYAAKALARHVADPTAEDAEEVKRVGRYVAGFPEMTRDVVVNVRRCANWWRIRTRIGRRRGSGVAARRAARYPGQESH